MRASRPRSQGGCFPDNASHLGRDGLGLQVAPAVKDAAVRGIPDDEAGEVPVAFVVPAEGADEAEIRAHLAGQLAHYKLPKRISFIEAIPKSASGKILRRMLPV